MAESKKGERHTKLLNNLKNGFDRISEADWQAALQYGRDYRVFLNASTTEREAVKTAVSMAEEAGFSPYTPGQNLKAGDRIYCINRRKAMLLAVMGQESLAEGMNLLAAHIDVPRIDLKPNPLYEDGELALFKTHY